MFKNKLIPLVIALILMSTSASAAIDNPRMQVDLNWVADTALGVHSTPVLYDVDGDGYEDIIVAASTSIYIFDHTGAVLTGWPKQSGRMGTGSSPVIGDVDGDGDIEIALGGSGSKNKYLYLWHHDGTPVAGWPKSLSSNPSSTPTLADIDDDGFLEVLIGTDGYIYAFNHDGSILSGWPKGAGNVKAQPVSADLDGDGMLEIVVASSNGNVYAWDHDGSMLWTTYVGEVYKSAPVAINIDSDADLEVVVSTIGGSVYVIDSDGLIISGWPVSTGDAIYYSTPSTADIDGDGDIEIVVGSDLGKVFAFHHDGTYVTGWPKTLPFSVTSSPNLYDIDGNGLPEIVVACDNGNVYAWNGEGTLISGWPQETMPYKWIKGKPAIGDIDNDGVLELIVGSYGKKVYSWDMNVMSNPPIAAIASPVNGSVITAGTSVNFISSSLDEDGYIVSYEWVSDKDGIIGNSQSPSSMLSAGEHNITLTVTDNDGLVSSSVAHIIINSPPSTSIDSPLADTVLKQVESVSFKGSGSDVDGEIVSYRWESDIDGVIGETPEFITTALSVGVHNITLTVTDNYGAENAAEIVIEQGGYDVSWLLKKNVTKTGSNIPVKFSVYEDGEPITDETVKVTILDPDNREVFTAGYGTESSDVRIDDGDYIVNYRCSKNAQAGVYTMKVEFASTRPGQDEQVTFSVMDQQETYFVNVPGLFHSSKYIKSSPSFEYEWTIGGMPAGTGEVISQTFTASGIHDMELIATNIHSGKSTTTTFRVIVNAQGDPNGDGAVNVLDLALIGLNFGKDKADDFDSGADTNGDGVINILDASVVGINWKRSI